jgi:hypothetical protein
MRPVPLPVLWALSALALGALLFNCATPPPDEPAGSQLTRTAQETEELLQGTWLREYSAQDVQVRRVLTLAPGGTFRESVRAVDAAGKVTEQAHEGNWFYDGSNLKRKYTLVDGKPPSRLNLPFATFEIAFQTRNEFTGVDHIHRNRIQYRRVAPQTQP